MTIAKIPIQAIAAGRSDTSLTATKHAWNENELHKRPRLLWVGPQGKLNTSEEEFSVWNGHVRWTYCDGDQVSAVNLEDVSPTLFANGSDIEIRGFVLSVHLAQSFFSINTFDDLQKNATSCEWTMTATASQLADGDANWAAATVVDYDARVVTYSHLPTDMSGVYLALQQQYWSKFGYSGRDYGLTYKEGQLRSDDFGLLTPFSFRLDLSTMAPDIPVRFNIDALRTGAPKYGIAQNNSTANLRLLMVGVDGYEVAK